MTNDHILKKGEFLVLLWTVFAAYVALYGLQPLLPAFGQAFHVSNQAASLIMTLGILPLGLAPVCYGYILNLCTTRTLIVASTSLCAASILVSLFATSFAVFLGLRALAALMIPAIVLGVMTHIATFESAEKMQRTMTVYTTVTMFGAFGGRIGSGLVANALDLDAVLVAHAVLLLTTLPFVCRLPESPTLQRDIFSPKHVLKVVRQPHLLALMSIGPLCIFAHASVLNMAPFHLRELLPDAGTFITGLLYAPAFVCTMLGVFSKRVLKVLHGEMQTIRMGVFIFIGSVLFLLFDTPLALFISIFFMTAGFVLVYTTLPGVVNRVSLSPKNMTNSVYLSVYYSLSALGTWLPILVYSNFGIGMYVCTLLIVFFLALGLAQKHIHLSLEKKNI